MKELKNQLNKLLDGESISLSDKFKSCLGEHILEYGKSASTNNNTRQVFYQAYKKLTGYQESSIGKSSQQFSDVISTRNQLNLVGKGHRKLQKLTKKLMKMETRGLILPEILQEPLIKELNDKPVKKVSKKDHNSNETKEVLSKGNVTEEQKKHAYKAEKRAEDASEGKVMAERKGKITPEKRTKASPVKKARSPEKKPASQKQNDKEEDLKKKSLKRISSEETSEQMKKLREVHSPLKRFKEDIILEVDEPMPEVKKKVKHKKVETKKVKFDLSSNTTKSILPIIQ